MNKNPIKSEELVNQNPDTMVKNDYHKIYIVLQGA